VDHYGAALFSCLPILAFCQEILACLHFFVHKVIENGDPVKVTSELEGFYSIGPVNASVIWDV
jgi:hypothetical protein